MDVTDISYTFYVIESYNWDIGDKVYWYFYCPDNDTLTGKPTGEYIKCITAYTRHDDEDTANCISYWYNFAEDIWGHWYEDYDVLYFACPPSIDDIITGWGFRPSDITPNGVYFNEYAFFPGKWYVEIWRKPAGGNLYFIKRDSFALKDTFTSIKIYSPSDSDTVIGRTGIEFLVWENHWAEVEISISSVPVKGREVWDTTIYVFRMKYPALRGIRYNFGFNEGQWFKVKGKVIDYSGNIKTDSISVVVGRPILAIELSSEEVKPYYENFIPENESKTQVIVHVFTPFGRPVEGYPVKVFARGVTKSGGHDHDGMDTLQYPRPVGIFTITEGFTDESGKFITTYRASEFGGIEKIFACGNVILPKDTVHKELTVRVPGLFLFPEGPYWLKVGGTCNHHGPPKPWDPIPTQCQEPDHNHYIAPLTYIRLSNVCHDYYYLTPHHRLCINDISLPYGGLFDINGNWIPPHKTHRMGVDIDIAKRVVDEQGQVVGWVNVQTLQKLVERCRGRLINEGNHYHIRF